LEGEAPPWTLREIADAVGGQLDGPPDLLIEGPVLAGSDDPAGITFAANDRFLARAESSKVGAVLVSPNAPEVSKPAVRVADPWKAFRILLERSVRPLPLASGIHETAVIDPGAQLDPSASLGPYAVIARGARIGARCKIYPFCYVGEDCVLEAGCVLYPHVVLYQAVRLGENTVVHSGAVLGADGFRYEWDGSRHAKVPQVGEVHVGRDSEIGANAAIDRATADSTALGKGVKVDNLVQIAHNVQIGDDCVIAAQTGIAGSAKVGNRVVMAGNVVLRDHVKVVDDVVLAGRAGVESDIERPGVYMGFPVMPGRQALRAMRLFTKLPELWSRLRRVERLVGGVEVAEDGESS
jgi:UDP-3-O-[3-hydroxymyristoyl] glucosamine N-acyltransferase